MFSAGQVSAPSVSGESFSDTRGNRRIVGAIRRLERNINDGLQPADPAYIHVSVSDLTARFRQITDVSVSVRNQTALILANAIWEFTDSRPSVTGETRGERVQSVTDGFGTFVENNIPSGLVRELTTKVIGVYRELAESLERNGSQFNDPNVWDEYQEGIEYLNLAAQATVVADALNIHDVRYEDLRALDRLSELIIHGDTERVGTGLLSLITRNSEGQIQFPPRFAEMVEMALSTVDFSSWRNFVRGNLEQHEFSTYAPLYWLYRIVDAASSSHYIDGLQQAGNLSLVSMLDGGESGLAQRFLKVMEDSKTLFSPVTLGEEVQVMTLRIDVYSLAVLASAQENMSTERRSLLDRTLELISTGFTRQLTSVEYRLPNLVENVLRRQESYPQIERKIVDLFDRVLNPLSTSGESSAIASLLINFLISVNQLYKELAKSGLPQNEKDYAAAHSVAATLLEITATQPLNPVRMILMEKAMTEDANDDLVRAMFYMRPLMDSNAQVWLNGLTDVTADNIDAILNRDYYRSGNGGSFGGATPAASGGPSVPPAPAGGQEEITSAAEEITGVVVNDEGDPTDETDETDEATYGADALEDGADIMFGAPWSETFVPECMPAF